MELSKPFVLQPAQARPGTYSPDAGGGAVFRTAFKLIARDTGGQFSLLEWSLDPWQCGPDLHAHNFDEAFYVLAGEVVFQVGEERYVLGPRQVAWMPRNTPHSFSNAGPETAAGLTVSTPGGLETIFAPKTGDNPATAHQFEVQHFGPPVRAPQPED